MSTNALAAIPVCRPTRSHRLIGYVFLIALLTLGETALFAQGETQDPTDSTVRTPGGAYEEPAPFYSDQDPSFSFNKTLKSQLIGNRSSETGTFAGFGAISGSGVVYMRSVTGSPWGTSTNEAAMNAVFGAGGWFDLRYETAVPANVFSSNTAVVFMEGGDFIANEMETFLNANRPLIEAWVASGGRLLLNSAPNEGNGMSYGFGGTTLLYAAYSPTVTSSSG